MIPSKPILAFALAIALALPGMSPAAAEAPALPKGVVAGPSIEGINKSGRVALNELSADATTTNRFSRRSNCKLESLMATRRRGSYSSSQAWVIFGSGIGITPIGAALVALSSPPNGHHQLFDVLGAAGAEATLATTGALSAGASFLAVSPPPKGHQLEPLSLFVLADATGTGAAAGAGAAAVLAAGARAGVLVGLAEALAVLSPAVGA